MYTRKDLSISLWCPDRKWSTYLISCFKCKYFESCKEVKKYKNILFNCDAVEKTIVAWNKRRINMLIVKFKNGTYAEINSDEDIKSEEAAEIDVVYKISQELIPVIKLVLVPKDKYEQKKVNALNAPKDDTITQKVDSTRKPKTRKSKSE